MVYRLSGKIQRMAVRQMSALVQGKPQDFIARIEQTHIHRKVSRRSGKRLDIYMLGIK